MPTVKDAVLAIESSWKSFNKTRSALSIKQTDRVVLVRLKASTLQLYRHERMVKSYLISISKRPPSNVANSMGTPMGLHAIAERIGAGQPAGMGFKSRGAAGLPFSEIAVDEAGTGNLITSRILWLKGLEPGVNSGGDVDTYKRFIYIHGTQRE